jgi:hypothetical protein
MKRASKTLNLFSIACMIFILIACNKSQDINSQFTTGDYIYQREGDFSQIRLFTKKGEIHNAKLLNYYTVKYDQLLFPFQSTNVPFVHDTFHIMASDSAKYNYIYQYGDTIYCSYCQGGISSIIPTLYHNDFKVSPIDYYYQFLGTDTLGYLGNIDSFNLAIQKYKPYYKVSPLPSFFGANKINTFKYFYASFNNNRLVFPGLNYVRFTTSYTIYPPSVKPFILSSRSSYYSLNNVFDATVLQRLSPTDTTYVSYYGTIDQKYYTCDTLLIQTYNTYYVK